MAINCTIFGAIDVNGDPLVMVAYRDDWGAHQILMPPAAAREMASRLIDQAKGAERLAARHRGEVDPFYKAPEEPS